MTSSYINFHLFRIQASVNEDIRVADGFVGAISNFVNTEIN